MGPGVARQQPVQCPGGRPEERGRHPDRRGDPDPVAVARHVLDGDPAVVAGDPRPDRAARAGQLLEPRTGGRLAALGPCRDLGRRQVPQPAQQVVDAVERRCPAVLGQRLEVQLEVGQGVRVEQLAQLLLAEQLAQQVAIERQRARAALGDRRVAVVHVGGDVVEHQAARERRGAHGLDPVDGDLASRHAPEDVAQAGQVEHVRQAFAVGLDQDRERAVARRDRQQVRRALTLLPQRRPRPRPAPRQEQRPRRVLAEPAGEQGRRRQLADDQVLELVGLGEEQRLDAVEGSIALGQPDGDPVVGPDGLHLEPEPLADPRLERQRPRRVDAAAERAQDAQPPVAELVAEPFDHDPLVRRQRAGRLALVVEIGEQVVRGELVEVVRLAQPLGRRAPARRPTREIGLQLAHERTERPTELRGPPDRVALPERELAGHAGRRADRDPVAADLLDPPAARPEHDHVAVHPGAELVDHLLVELTDAATGRPRFADHEHAEQATIRDRAAAGHRHDPRIAAALDHVGHAVPHDARLELGELVGRIGAGEHPEHALENLAGERLVWEGAPRDGQQVVHRPAIHDRHRHELLGEDVERIARDLGRLDGAFMHPAGDDRAFEQVAAVLREDHALARGADLVPRPTDPLEAAGHAGRALDLDDEVHGAHVDAELEAGRGDQRGEPTGLELFLDLEPLLAGDAAVVGPDQLLAGQLVEPLGETLGQPPAVGEDDRAAVAADQLEDARVDRRPDAGPHVAARRRRAARLLLEREHLPERRHVVDRDDDLEVERLARAGIDDGDLAPGTDPAEEPRDRVERPLRGRQADALHGRRVGVRAIAERLESFEAEREVGAALGAGDGVDLVDDDVLHPAQDVARRAGQHQVERLGRGDQDVRRVAGDVAPVLGRRVAGPAGDRDAGNGLTEALRGQGDPGQRCSQVALDVVGQRLERRDVEDPDEPGCLAGGCRAGMGRQPVERPEEGGEGLAAAGRGVDQGVVAG